MRIVRGRLLVVRSPWLVVRGQLSIKQHAADILFKSVIFLNQSFFNQSSFF